MKTAYWIGAGIVAIVIIVLAVKMLGASSASNTQMASSTDTTQTTMSSSTAEQGSAPATAVSGSGSASAGTKTAAPSAQHFAVNGNDATADLKTITVAPGTPVTITFGADAGSTYHGGLDFRSSVVNTGTIAPGSTKTISFTATKSFSFTPYWPATNIAKPYTIDIVVK